MTKLVYLTLGSLIERVNAEAFIAFLTEKALAKARLQGKKLDLPLLIDKGLQLADEFNQEVIGNDEIKELKSSDSEEESDAEITFRVKLLKLFDVSEIGPNEFWKKWNEMITLGDNFPKRIQLLQANGEEHKGDLIEIYSDTNFQHLKKIAKDIKDIKGNEEQKISLTFAKASIMNKPVNQCANFPFHATCINRSDIVEVLRKMIDQAKKRGINPIDIILIYPDPEKFQNDSQKTKAEAKLEKIQALCKEKGVKPPILQDAPLGEMLEKVYQPKLAPVATRAACTA